jgi:hypothetical protein
MPTVRAENSSTSRHLAEFWMVEPEIAFADLSDNAALAEALLKYTFAALLNGEREVRIPGQVERRPAIGARGSQFVDSYLPGTAPGDFFGHCGWLSINASRSEFRR